MNNNYQTEEVSEYLLKGAFNHNKYYHYTNFKSINGIINSNCFWISSMCYSNDKREHTSFGEDTYLYFQFCFSFGSSEILPMWFLYCGAKGKGARLGINKKDLFKIIETASIYLVKHGESEQLLVKDVDYQIMLRDIVYWDDNKDNVKIKHKNFSKDISSLQFDLFINQNDNKGFVKNIVWKYENETRLLIKVREGLLDKDLFVNSKSAHYRLEMRFSNDFYKSFELTLSPYYTKDRKEEISDVIEKHLGIKKIESKVKLSDNAGWVEIDLCKDCC